MAQEKNGCLIFLGILAGLAVVSFVLVGVGYAGLTVIIGIDSAARAFTWLGITSPAWAWLALGCVIGAFVGLVMGLKRAQRSPGLPVYGGVAVMACLIFFGAFYPRYVERNDYVQTPTPTYKPTSQFNSFTIGNVTANVSSISFFEQGQKALSKEQRTYTTRFAKTTSRYINFEIHLTYPDPGRQNDFTLDFTFYKPDGTVFSKNALQSYIKKGWTDSYHYSGTGWPKPGNWSVGTYKVELSAAGKIIATGQFQIY